MEKLIIENRTDIPISEMMARIWYVLKQGKISSGRFGVQYCFITTWKDGTGIQAFQNKNSDRLVIFKEERETDLP